MDRICIPVEEGGSVALRPGGLTPEGYLGLVLEKTRNLFKY